MESMHRFGHLPIKILPLVALLITCDHGLQPVDQGGTTLATIGGTIYYSNWSAAGRTEDLRLIVFPDYPPDNIQAEVLSERAIVFPALGEAGLPFPDVDSTEYQFQINPGTYEYVVVALRYGPDSFNDWRAVGQYDTLAGDQLPTAITLRAGDILAQLNISVNFDSLPPQPF